VRAGPLFAPHTHKYTHGATLRSRRATDYDRCMEYLRAIERHGEGPSKSAPAKSSSQPRKRESSRAAAAAAVVAESHDDEPPVADSLPPPARKRSAPTPPPPRLAVAPQRTSQRAASRDQAKVIDVTDSATPRRSSRKRTPVSPPQVQTVAKFLPVPTTTTASPVLHRSAVQECCDKENAAIENVATPTVAHQSRPVTKAVGQGKRFTATESATATATVSYTATHPTTRATYTATVTVTATATATASVAIP
jgi:hypothetical protein